MVRNVKIISVFLAVVLIFSFPLSCFAAEDLSPGESLMWDNFFNTLGEINKVAITCPKCGAGIRKKDGGTCPSCGFNASIDDGTVNNYRPGFESGGGSASPGGVGRNPAGYAGEGTPSYNVDGDLFVLAKPIFYATGDVDKTPVDAGRISYTKCVIDLSCPFISYRSTYNQSDYVYCFTKSCPYQVAWYFTCPVDGVYFTTKRSNISSSYDTDRYIEIFNSKYKSGDKIYLNHNNSAGGFRVSLEAYSSLSVKLNSILVKCIPDKVSVTKSTNITINNNTWNGNIYVDNSTNLTYIYPQYTTINENNETVTNISNNPIIYNQETKQYYTYDQTTNNYYYITYGDPAPTPGGSGGGSGDSPSGGGSNWWDKLLDDILSGLLEGVKGILKLLFDLFSSILGWIIWLCSKVFDLFPFLPTGVGALLVGGVVVCFILAFIKFIRG